jgi:hypothetical protein
VTRRAPEDLAVSHEVGERLLHVLGLTDQHVKKIELQFEAGDLVYATVTRYVTNRQVESIFDHLQTVRFRLIAAPEDGK